MKSVLKRLSPSRTNNSNATYRPAKEGNYRPVTMQAEGEFYTNGEERAKSPSLLVRKLATLAAKKIPSRKASIDANRFIIDLHNIDLTDKELISILPSECKLEDYIQTVMKVFSGNAEMDIKENLDENQNEEKREFLERVLEKCFVDYNKSQIDKEEFIDEQYSALTFASEGELEREKEDKNVLRLDLIKMLRKYQEMILEDRQGKVQNAIEFIDSAKYYFATGEGIGMLALTNGMFKKGMDLESNVGRLLKNIEGYTRINAALTYQIVTSPIKPRILTDHSSAALIAAQHDMHNRRIAGLKECFSSIIEGDLGAPALKEKTKLLQRFLNSLDGINQDGAVSSSSSLLKLDNINPVREESVNQSDSADLGLLNDAKGIAKNQTLKNSETEVYSELKVGRSTFYTPATEFAQRMRSDSNTSVSVDVQHKKTLKKSASGPSLPSYTGSSTESAEGSLRNKRSKSVDTNALSKF